MQNLVDRYRGKKTPKGHVLRVDERDDEATIWYLYWGRLQGVDDHHHMGIARVRRDGDTYAAGFLRGMEQSPYRTESYADEAALFLALDEAIAGR